MNQWKLLLAASGDEFFSVVVIFSSPLQQWFVRK